MRSSLDFYRLGFDGRVLMEPNPVPKVMSRCDKSDDLEARGQKVREYMDETFGEEAQGWKFEKLMQVQLNGTVRRTFLLLFCWYGCACGGRFEFFG